MPFVWAYDKASKLDHTAESDTILDRGTAAASNLLDLIGGNGNVLIYLGIGLVAVIVLPKLLDMVL